MQGIPHHGMGWSSCPDDGTSRKKNSSNVNLNGGLRLSLPRLLLLLLVGAVTATATAGSGAPPEVGGDHDSLSSNWLRTDGESATSNKLDNSNSERGNNVDSTASIVLLETQRNINKNHRSLQDGNENNDTEVLTPEDIDDEFCALYCEEEDASNGWVSALPVAVQYLLMLLLIAFSALFSGLTLGLMGLDKTVSEVT